MRLLPRFSLRFAMLALTIFLIVFGVGAKYWTRFKAHERLVAQLENQLCAVEEIPITLLGLEVGKRLVGIEVNESGEGHFVELLEQIPEPVDIRHFGLQSTLPSQPLLERLLEILSRLTNLEELYLHDLTFTREQARSLGCLTKLRVLDLSRCNIPRGGLSFLNQLPELERLILDETWYNINELYAISLPRLKYLDLSHSRFTTLELTKSGWGRFSNLETLVVLENKIGRISSEPGALPCLKHLLLGSIAEECQIEWEDWPVVMPKLVTLAMPTRWLQPALVEMLSKIPDLRYMYLQHDELITVFSNHSNTSFRRISSEDLPKSCPARLLSSIRNLQQANPDLLFSEIYSDFYNLLIGRQNGWYKPHLWQSPYWREAPTNSSGVAFGSYSGAN